MINPKDDVNWNNILFIDCYTQKSERKLLNGEIKDSGIMLIHTTPMK